MTAKGGEDPDHGLDIDAAFADIVANLGDLGPTEPLDKRPTDATETDPDQEREAPSGPVVSTPDSLRAMFAPMWQPDPPAADPEGDAGTPWDDEGHFVPPEPPPLPRLEPRRKAAWIALFGAPLGALVLLVLQVAIPGWLGFALGLVFVGGFGYLVATMGNGPEDPLSGSDGAVV